VVDGGAELRMPEIGSNGLENVEGDIPVEAELVDCGGDDTLHPDLADEGHNNAPVRRVESDRLLAGRQIEVEEATVDGKELGKESESIASEGVEDHCEKAAGKRRDGQREG
jgi:hypothetical protein